MSEYFSQIIYGVKSFLTGMKLTLNHFNKKKDLVATLQYPHEKWPVPERDIGFEHSEYNLIRSRLHVDIDDCIACMQCERACPVDCIKIDSIKPPKDNNFDCGMTSNDTQKKMVVSRFTIDMSECMYCNLCVFPCPEECIYMVGGPNDTKHEIDYEFSQYKRDGMIFEFADASDEVIASVGGEKWIKDRDLKIENLNDLSKIESYEEEPIKTVDTIKTEKPKVDLSKSDKSNQNLSRKFENPSYNDLSVKSFNSIEDRVARGISKKIFLINSKKGMILIDTLNEISESLKANNKMSSDIQSFIDKLISNAKLSNGSDSTSGPVHSLEVTSHDSSNLGASNEIDIKDLNAIEDKMTRGTAKKAFLAAKKSGEDRVEAVRKSIEDAGLMDDKINQLLTSFASNDVKTDNPVPVDEVVDKKINENVDIDSSDLPLFEIVSLNAIEDKVVRGMAKKVYISGKRADKTRIEVVEDIHASLKDAGKLDESLEKFLNDLRKKD